MEDRETLRSLIYKLVRQVDDEAGVPTPAQIAASLRALSKRLAAGYQGTAVPRRTLAESTELEPTLGRQPGWRAGQQRDRFVGQPLWRWAWYTLAAGIIGTAGLIIGQHSGSLQSRRRMVGSALTYTTAPGERANITLPDGNTVALDVASRLDVPADYVAGNHTVRLNGEGLFTVLHHENVPFTVIAGQTAARVLGTSFLVRHYTSDTTATVAVRAGKVAVSAPAEPRSVVLSADQQVHVGGTAPFSAEPATPAQFTFATGILTLAGPPLSQAIPELDRWYDADIRLGDPALATQRITGKFAAGSLADLAVILELTFDVRVVRSGRVLTLIPR